jgi:hypothetical protein
MMATLVSVAPFSREREFRIVDMPQRTVNGGFEETGNGSARGIGFGRLRSIHPL